MKSRNVLLSVFMFLLMSIPAIAQSNNDTSQYHEDTWFDLKRFILKFGAQAEDIDSLLKVKDAKACQFEYSGTTINIQNIRRVIINPLGNTKKKYSEVPELFLGSLSFFDKHKDYELETSVIEGDDIVATISEDYDENYHEPTFTFGKKGNYKAIKLIATSRDRPENPWSYIFGKCYSNVPKPHLTLLGCKLRYKPSFCSDPEF